MLFTFILQVRTIANCIHVRIKRGLKIRTHNQLIDSISFQPIQRPQKIRCFDSGRPNSQGRNYLLSVTQCETTSSCCGYTNVFEHSHPKVFKTFLNRI